MLPALQAGPQKKEQIKDISYNATRTSGGAPEKRTNQRHFLLGIVRGEMERFWQGSGFGGVMPGFGLGALDDFLVSSSRKAKGQQNKQHP
jgi:hypothetical protein